MLQYCLRGSALAALPPGKTDTRYKSAVITENKRLSNLDGLRHYPQIARIDASANALRDLRFVYFLPLLSQLDVSGNAIVSIEPLREARSLTRLCISNNKIDDLRPLDHLECLQFLDASKNNIRSVRLFYCSGLEELILDDNKIEGPVYLGKNPRLQYLSLRNNKISSTTELV